MPNVPLGLGQVRGHDCGPRIDAEVGLLGIDNTRDPVPPALGLMQYPDGLWPAPFAPVWIVVMWMLFATTLGGVLRSLQQRPLLAALVGAAGAPLAYYSGARLGALALTRPVPALLAEAAGWALLLPLLLMAARRMDV